MDPRQRTQDIFEHIPGYQKPPLVTLPEFGDFSTLEYLGYKSNFLSDGIIKIALGITGFHSFWKELSENLEPILRHSNLRSKGLYSPIFSATLSLLDDPRQLDPFQRAATLLFGAKSLYDDLWSARFPQDMYGDEPLEMGQYPNLFSTSLVIEGEYSRLYKSVSTSQLTVLTGGRVFILETGQLGVDCDVSLLVNTLKRLRRISIAGDSHPQTPPVGLLTSANEFTTIKAFNHLEQDGKNRTSLDLLRHSFLTLCLDLDDNPATYAEAARLAQSANFENRWNHASLQIIVFGNARASALFNFNAYLDGNAMARSGAEIQKRALGVSIPPSDVSDEKLIIEKELEWNIPPGLLENARADINLVLDNQQATYEIQGIGSSILNQLDIPAVPTFILSLEMACRKFTGHTVNIVQMMSMTKYRCMDLTSASVTTPEVLAFLDAIENKDLETKKFKELFQMAVDSQVQRAREAREAMSFDKILGLFIYSRLGFKRQITLFIVGLSFFLLRMLKMSSPVVADVIASHPEIYPQIPVFGRPGVRLTYTKHFGLHYQIMADKTVITMMPGLNWTVTNEEFITELTRNLEYLVRKLEHAHGLPS